ncbi:ArsI/CadI family heavy metal resistance metalloenzyme [Kytococcus sedentarius]|uniref:ArsI/CadI family heavy metal resistance metalloenzyme n=1 Tax=Kytococcus sedentarius TaxID=1276 RepID=UPI0035BC597E
MSRIQLALTVRDVERSVAFYTHLLGTEPHKRRPGYANFDVAEPPLKLVLIEGTSTEAPATDAGGCCTTRPGSLNHLGIEVTSVDEVHAARERLTAAGLATFDENDTTCCYARQDKVWVHDPDGIEWEVYTITDDDPTDAQPPTQHLPGDPA